jgi:hypothetical protein
MAETFEVLKPKRKHLKVKMREKVSALFRIVELGDFNTRYTEAEKEKLKTELHEQIAPKLNLSDEDVNQFLLLF